MTIPVWIVRSHIGVADVLMPPGQDAQFGSEVLPRHRRIADAAHALLVEQERGTIAGKFGGFFHDPQLFFKAVPLEQRLDNGPPRVDLPPG